MATNDPRSWCSLRELLCNNQETVYSLRWCNWYDQEALPLAFFIQQVQGEGETNTRNNYKNYDEIKTTLEKLLMMFYPMSHGIWWTKLTLDLEKSFVNLSPPMLRSWAEPKLGTAQPQLDVTIYHLTADDPCPFGLVIIKHITCTVEILAAEFTCFSNCQCIISS